MRPAVVTLVAVVSLGVGIGLGIWGNRTHATLPKARGFALSEPNSEPSRPASERPSERPRPKPSPMRARIEEEAERAPVHDARDVDRYLDSLEAQARKQGKVTALEIEPGIDRIQRFSPNPDEKIAEFGRRMQRVQQELSGTPPPSAPDRKVVEKQLDSLLEGVRFPKDDAEKQTSIRKYIELASTLEEPQQSNELQALNQAAGVHQSPPDPRSADSLWTAIQDASEADRQDLIRDYVTLVGQLPEAEQDARLAELNARYRQAPPDGYRFAR